MIAVLAALTFVGGMVAASALTNARELRVQRAARIEALPPADALLARALRAEMCFQQLAPNVYSLSRRGEVFDATVTRGRGSVGVSVTTRGLTEREMAAAAEAYHASGQSPELYEQVAEAVDLGLIRRDALRC